MTTGTARTLRPGDFQHAIGLAPRIFVNNSCLESGGGCRTDFVAQPPAPLYQLRWGITERFELGFVAGVPEFAARARWNFFRSESTAAAIQAGAFYNVGVGFGVDVSDGPQPDSTLFGIEPAALFDFHVSDRVTLIPRLILRWIPNPEPGMQPESALIAESGVAIQLTNFLALEPSIGVFAPTDYFGESIAPRIGISFAWGAFPYRAD